MMIPSVFKYAYPNAKIRAMKARLLSKNIFHALLNAESYPDYLDILHTTGYNKTLQETESEDISIAVLTHLLYKNLFSDHYKIIRSFTGNLQQFFILFYQKYELINLKTILKGIIIQENPETIRSLLLPTERYTLFSKTLLLDCRKVQDVVALMQGTFFQYPLNQALRRFENEQEFFPLEMALDLHYYHTLWNELEKLSGEELHTIKKFLGILIDILNITWIIRFKEQYHFSTEEILNYTIQHGYFFKLKERRRFAEARSLNDLLAYLETTEYGGMISGHTSINTLHVVLTRYLLPQLQQCFVGQPFHIKVIVGYLLLKEFEIADLITLAEAKMYGFSFEQTQDYVINVR